jgi:hypothetical protein
MAIYLHISRIRRNIRRRTIHTLPLETMGLIIITTILPEKRTKPGIRLEPSWFPTKTKSVAIKL